MEPGSCLGSKEPGTCWNLVRACVAAIHRGLVAIFFPPRIRYGPTQQPLVESIFCRDRNLASVRTAFESAISEADIENAKMLGNKIG